MRTSIRYLWSFTLTVFLTLLFALTLVDPSDAGRDGLKPLHKKTAPKKSAMRKKKGLHPIGKKEKKKNEEADDTEEDEE